MCSKTITGLRKLECSKSGQSEILHSFIDVLLSCVSPWIAPTEVFPLTFFSLFNKPPCHCDRQSPVTFTVKVNETSSTGISDVLQLYSFCLLLTGSKQTKKHILRRLGLERNRLDLPTCQRTVLKSVDCF